MKAFLKVFIAIISVLYPVLVFTLLVVYKFPVRIVSLCVVFLALVYFISATSENPDKDKSGKKHFSFNLKPLISSIFLLIIGIACFLTNSSLFLKLYPIVVCATLLFVFGITIFTRPNIIFRFATLQDKSIIGSVNEKRVERYCLKVTYIWCSFFILNSLVAAYTAFFCDEKIWTIYNCGISYGIMGIIFAVEFIVRSFVNKKMPKFYPISKFTADSRKDDDVLTYEEFWSSKKYKTWKDFLTDSAKMRKFIQSKNEKKWILHCDDYYYFLCTYIALFQCKKEIALTANISEEFIKEMREENDGFLTDSREAKNSVYIPEVIENSAIPAEEEIRTTPAINADETKIFMFTSGSTGKPKAILQRLTEFELDNEFIFSLWGDELLKRKVVATLSQHHIYGLLFSAMLPFAAGIPVRRHRIEFPTEFEKLTDESYFVVAVPAFLKRTVEVEEKLNMKNPFIVTSGGVLLPEVAAKTEKVFVFWPMEVYGSTETSGIAYRQSKNGLEWTPFANAELSVNEDGCLNIKSPYIKDPAGFQTADLVDIHSDGKFILRGRKDSIVKIEEKRISLTEVENRILQTGLVKDVCVIAMSDRRQYLAAAIVFNEEGKKKFADWKKFDINMYFHDYLIDFFENVVLPKKWRYLDELPMDLQGKKKKQDIEALFTKNEDSDNITQ